MQDFSLFCSQFVINIIIFIAESKYSSCYKDKKHYQTLN